MKRLICLALCLVLALCGCTAVTENKEKLQVVTTIFPAYDFARQIGGEWAEVTMLLPPGGEVHAYEPSVSDLVAIKNCDVFIYNGGESDGWIETMLSQCDMTDKTVIRLTDHVELLMTGEQHHHHEHEHDHHEADEHIWTTPRHALVLAKTIEQALAQQDAAHAREYAKGATVLCGQLSDLKDQYEVLRQNPVTLVVADRFPFFYLAHEYGLSYVAAFDGCTSNTEADLATVYQLTQAAKQSRSHMVLCTEFSDRVLANTVAEASDGKVGMWHSCHNVTREEWDAKVTYVALMQNNVMVLKEALGL